jgi:nucleotide-binding universal stress UspA family protein
MIAVGGNKVDEETVRLACRLARGQDSQLYAIHVIEVNRSLPLGAVLEHQVERGEQILDEVEQLAAEADLTVETELVQARETGSAVVGEALDWEADVIVMGLPYKRRFGEFNMGRTVPYVLKNASCRVILYRERLETTA